jgi:hypothetical protein
MLGPIRKVAALKATTSKGSALPAEPRDRLPADSDGENVMSKALARAGSGLVMDLLQPVDRRRDALEAGL